MISMTMTQLVATHAIADLRLLIVISWLPYRSLIADSFVLCREPSHRAGIDDALPNILHAPIAPLVAQVPLVCLYLCLDVCLPTRCLPVFQDILEILWRHLRTGTLCNLNHLGLWLIM